MSPAWVNTQLTSSKTSSGQPGRSTFLEPHRPSGRQARHERVEEAQARRRVHSLAEQTSRQSSVEIHEFARGEKRARHAERGWFGTVANALAGELEADFDHVDGLDHGRCGHAGEAAGGGLLVVGLEMRRVWCCVPIDERECGAHCWGVEKVLFCCWSGCGGDGGG